MTNKKILMTSLIAMIFLIGFSDQNAFSHGNVDQETLPLTDNTLSSGVTSNFLKGQVFVPTADNLIAVDVALNTSPFSVGDTIDITIHQGTDSFNVPGTEFDRIGTIAYIDGDTHHLNLDSPVPLIPGTPHILELVSNDPNSFSWWGTNTSTYPDGKFVFCNIGLSLCDDVPEWDHSFRTYFAPATIDVDIEIKPNGDPNSINTKSMGLVPVAILGSETFDVTDVDFSTLAFGPNGATPVHKNPHIEDVNGDGFLDLVLHYPQNETGIACGDTEATLSGLLLDGTPFEGTDSVNPICKP